MSEPKHYRLFVYGTLKRLAETNESFYIRGDLYDLGPFPAAKRAGQESAGWIKGKILVVTAKEIAFFDQVEGVPRFYDRKVVDVFDDKKRRVFKALVYEFVNHLNERNRIGEVWNESL